MRLHKEQDQHDRIGGKQRSAEGCAQRFGNGQQDEAGNGAGNADKQDGASSILVGKAPKQGSAKKLGGGIRGRQQTDSLTSLAPYCSA